MVFIGDLALDSPRGCALYAHALVAAARSGALSVSASCGFKWAPTMSELYARYQLRAVGSRRTPTRDEPLERMLSGQTVGERECFTSVPQ